MLRVIVQLIPCGDESRATELARADIGNVSRGAMANYRVRVRETDVEGGKLGEVKGYPRWSASIWDLVLRMIAKAQYGEEQIPPRPELLDVSIRRGDGFAYVRLADIPEPARTAFRDNLDRWRSGVPPGDGTPGDCAFADDWVRFQAGER